MPRPLFHPGGGSLRLADAALYASIVASYQFGTPVIQAVAPSVLASTYGAVVYTADPGINASIPGVVVPDNVVAPFGVAVSRSVGAGTLVGVNYTDSNGVLWPDVDWSWTISVELYTQTGGGDPLGSWFQQVVTFAGDGTSNRLIATNFSLASGVVAVWFFPQTAFQPYFRHNQGMTGSISANGAVLASDVILTFEAGGFRVHADSNVIGQSYTAVVLCDTSGRCMQAGVYTGQHDETFTPNVTSDPNPPYILVISGGRQFVPSDTGRTFVIATPPGMAGILTFIDAFHAQGAQWFGTSGITTTGTIYSINRLLTTSPNPGAAFIFGNHTAYRSSVFTDDGTTSLGSFAYAASDQITGFNGGIALGQDDNVNKLATTFYWLALTFQNSDAAGANFKQFAATGTGGSVVVDGFSFTPGFAVTKQYDPSVVGGIWRGPLHAGTNSTKFDAVSAGAEGIKAFASGSLTLGTTAVASGKNVYGFTLPAAPSTVVITSPPTYDPVPTPVPPTDPTVTPIPNPIPIPHGPDDVPLGPTDQQACRITGVLGTN